MRAGRGDPAGEQRPVKSDTYSLSKLDGGNPIQSNIDCTIRVLQDLLQRLGVVSWLVCGFPTVSFDKKADERADEVNANIGRGQVLDSRVVEII